MEDWITGALAVLGTLMVLSGAALIVLRTLDRLPGGRRDEATTVPQASLPAGQPDEPSGGRRMGLKLRRLSPTTQLIVWGVVLLILAALTVGLISFDVSLNASTQ